MLTIPFFLGLLVTCTQLLVLGKPLQTRSDDDASVDQIKIRIEGAEKTIFEGRVPVFSRVITTPSGGTHRCDGTNNKANPRPGPTCTTALNDAGKLHGFGFDATFSTEFDDYFITSIAGDSQTDDQFWGILVNYRFTPKGGCQTEVFSRDEVLWAFDAFSKAHFLKLEGPNVAKAGTSVQLKVTDGMNGTALEGAIVKRIDGTTAGTSNRDGTVSVDLPVPGVHSFKASRDDSIRSNRLTIVVRP